MKGLIGQEGPFRNLKKTLTMLVTLPEYASSQNVEGEEGGSQENRHTDQTSAKSLRLAENEVGPEISSLAVNYETDVAADSISSFPLSDNEDLRSRQLVRPDLNNSQIRALLKKKVQLLSYFYV